MRGLPVRDTEGRIKKWIGTATDVDEERRARQELSCAEHRYRQLTLATAGAIAASVDARDPYTAGHQRRVAAISAAIGAELHLPDVDIEGIRLAASIHDIGKLGVPLELLACPRRLVPAEFELIKTHAQIGHDIVAGIEFPWPVADMIVQHHERLDGSGYPNGLTGDEIVVGARIIAVADTVEAMGSHRPFRPARGLDVALDEIKVNAGRLYDQSVASACDELFRSGRLQLDTLA
ncbi:MAG: HD domain-containing protein [Actinobacteria bacterium]|nr:HD domain-containing protein [Actinomycetota bacterium]